MDKQEMIFKNLCNYELDVIDPTWLGLNEIWYIYQLKGQGDNRHDMMI